MQEAKLSKKQDKKYYFAYGSNLHKAGMITRCPDSEPIIAGMLLGKELLFRRFATIQNNILDRVYGAIYEVSKEDEKQLDLYEGFPHLYRKETVKIKGMDGKSYLCFVYILNEETVEYGPPTPNYYNTLINGFTEWGLPDGFLAKAMRVTTVYMEEDKERGLS